MCLYVYKHDHERFLDKYGKHSFIMAYKVVKLSVGYNATRRLVGPYQESHRYQRGENKSNRLDKYVSWSRDYGVYPYAIINKGIHVCLTAEAAEQVRRETSSGEAPERQERYRIIKVRCYMKDCIAGSLEGNLAAFMTIHISRDEYRKGTRQ